MRNPMREYESVYDRMLADVDNGDGMRWHDIGMKVYDEAYLSFVAHDTEAAESNIGDVRYGVTQCSVHATRTDIERHLRSPLSDTLDEARHGNGILQAFAVDPVDADADETDDNWLREWIVTVIVAVHGGVDPSSAADACMMSHALRLESIPDDERFDRFSAVIDE